MQASRRTLAMTFRPIRGFASHHGKEEKTEHTCSQGETDEVRVVWGTTSQEERILLQ